MVCQYARPYGREMLARSLCAIEQKASRDVTVLARCAVSAARPPTRPAAVRPDRRQRYRRRQRQTTDVSVQNNIGLLGGPVTILLNEDSFVCLFVCLSVSLHISKTIRPIFHQIFCTCYLWSWIGPSDGNAIRYVLPVLWMTSCFHMMDRIGQNQG